MHRKRARRICGDLRKVSKLSLAARKKKVDFGLLAGARPVALWRVPHVLGVGRWKSQNRKNVYLSPYVEKPLNSKVIKCFVPELRSRQRFSCFGIPMFYVYMLWTFYVRFTYPYHGYGTISLPLTEKKQEKLFHSSEIVFFFWYLHKHVWYA